MLAEVNGKVWLLWLLSINEAALNLDLAVSCNGFVSEKQDDRAIS